MDSRSAALFLLGAGALATVFAPDAQKDIARWR